MKILSHHPIYVRTLPVKSKPTFLLWFLKRSSVHVTATLSNLNTFHCINFALLKLKIMYKTKHAFSYLLLKDSVADDVINVLLLDGPVL